jgi:hypothetical protein
MSIGIAPAKQKNALASVITCRVRRGLASLVGAAIGKNAKSKGSDSTGILWITRDDSRVKVARERRTLPRKTGKPKINRVGPL